jgi:peptidoglycan/LPS O-acetylase OafA/YrhL
MGRIRELDGLRGAAILLVVVWHYLGIGDGPFSVPFRAFVFGRTGVDLFFVLSGYLITTILLVNRKSPFYFSAFYGRRSFRILPIYFVMLAIYLIGRQLGGSAPLLFGGPLPWWSYVIGLQNFWMVAEQSYGASWLAVTWSLAVEEQFYLIFPLIVYFVPARILPKLLVALLVLCPIGRAISYSTGDEMGYYVLMPLRADILAAGALIAWLEYSGSINAAIRQVLQVTFWSSVCFFPIFAWMIDHSDRTMAVWGHSYLVALYGSTLFMVLDHRGSPQLAFLRSRFAAFFARISYALYLTHGYVLTLAFMAAGYGGGNHTILTWQGIALTVCAFAISVAICWASYLLIEGPMINAAHRKFSFGDARDISSEASAAVVAARTSFRVPKLQSKHERTGATFAIGLIVAVIAVAIYWLSPPQRTLVLLAAGQSNAGNMSAVLSKSAYGSRVSEFFDGKLYVASDPLRASSDSLGSPWVALANALIAKGAYDNVVIALVAKGGTSIREWRSGGELNRRLANASEALAQAGIPANVFAYVQGESERFSGSEYQDTQKYGEALSEVIGTVRKSAPLSKVYVAQTSWCPFDEDNPTGPIKAVRDAQAASVGDNIFLGPDLDAISEPGDRRDFCHLSEQGHRKFVAEWLRILTK